MEKQGNNQAKLVDYSQKIFPVSEFHKALGNSFLTPCHDKTAGIYTSEHEHLQSVINYSILGDDVAIWHERTEMYVPYRSRVSPNKKSKFYVLGCLLDANMPMRYEYEDSEFIIRQGTVFFYNSFTGTTVHIPQHFRGTEIQCLVSHDFIMEYFNPNLLKNPTLRNIILGNDCTLFTMEQAPGPILRKMSQVKEKLLQPPSTPLNKIGILRNTSDIFMFLFKMHIGGELPAFNYTGKNEPDITQAGTNLKSMIHVPFPGIDFLAQQHGLSSSGFKRAFKQQYKTTPLRYFRKQQMAQALHWLEHTQQPVKSIAERLGFDTSGNFIRAFKGEYGTTPGKLRNNL